MVNTASLFRVLKLGRIWFIKKIWHIENEGLNRWLRLIPLRSSTPLLRWTRRWTSARHWPPRPAQICKDGEFAIGASWAQPTYPGLDYKFANPQVSLVRVAANLPLEASNIDLI